VGIFFLPFLALFIYTFYKYNKLMTEKEKILVFESEEKELEYKKYRLRIICKQNHLG
jgi:hypothetical protein